MSQQPNIMQWAATTLIAILSTAAFAFTANVSRTQGETTAKLSSTTERVAGVEAQNAATQASLIRIESKLDRVIETRK